MQASSSGAAQLDSQLWPVERLADACEVLARRSGLLVQHAELPPVPAGLESAPQRVLDRWLGATALHLGIEVESISAPYGDLRTLVGSAGPALLAIDRDNTRRLLLLLPGTSRKRARILRPDLRQETLRVEELERALTAPLEQRLVPRLDELLQLAGLPARSRDGVRRKLLEQRLRSTPVEGCWMLRPRAGASFVHQLAQAGVLKFFYALVGLQLLQHLLLIGAWTLLGHGALEGRLEAGWLVAWALLLATMVALGMTAVWVQGRLALGSGAVLKARLLRGALRLDPDVIRGEGSGQLLGRVHEAEAMEMLALSGGLAAAGAVVELLVTVGVLALGAGGWLHATALLLWLAAVVLLCVRLLRHQLRWVLSRPVLTNGLVERMVGHRTRLAQEHPRHWHDGEDQSLDDYQTRSRSLDRTAIWLLAVGARGWMLAGFALLAPAFIAGDATVASLAISVGGILLAQQSLGKVTTSVVTLGNALIAWRQVRPLFQAAGREPTPQKLESITTERGQPEPGAALLQAEALVFRYPGRARPIIDGASVELRRGDRVLLEGPSGCGKSTLAALLMGTRTPSSGLLLLDGLDPPTLGTLGWTQRVAAAPQFHENHVFTDTLAFNVLMGRGWPVSAAELGEAEQICRELGLGELLDRMPSGMLQLVGESGWQLSHGERSRVFLARALVENAELVILDESLAALDPVNLERAAKCLLQRAPAALVIAHP